MWPSFSFFFSHVADTILDLGIIGLGEKSGAVHADWDEGGGL